MEVERQMRRIDGDVVSEQSAYALKDPTAERLRAAPEQSVMHDEQIGAGRDRRIDGLQ